MYFQMSFMPLQSQIEIDNLLKVIYHNSCFALHLKDIPIYKEIGEGYKFDSNITGIEQNQLEIFI